MKKSTETPLQVLHRCEQEITRAIRLLIHQEVCVNDPDETWYRKAGVVIDVVVGSALYVKVRFSHSKTASFMPGQLIMKPMSVH